MPSCEKEKEGNEESASGYKEWLKLITPPRTTSFACAVSPSDRTPTALPSSQTTSTSGLDSMYVPP